MIELIALIFITREIGRLAVQKGLRHGKWKFVCIGFWFALEFVGVIAGLLIFSVDNIVSIALLALAFAFTSYFILKNYLEKLPDAYDEDIENIWK